MFDVLMSSLRSSSDRDRAYPPLATFKVVLSRQWYRPLKEICETISTKWAVARSKGTVRVICGQACANAGQYFVIVIAISFCLISSGCSVSGAGHLEYHDCTEINRFLLHCYAKYVEPTAEYMDQRQSALNQCTAEMNSAENSGSFAYDDHPELDKAELRNFYVNSCMVDRGFDSFSNGRWDNLARLCRSLWDTATRAEASKYAEYLSASTLAGDAAKLSGVVDSSGVNKYAEYFGACQSRNRYSGRFFSPG